MDSIKKGLQNFKGVRRRFTHTGSWNEVEIFDDYAHHPVEISAVLKAARTAVRSAGDGRVIAIKQPHRYSRLNDLFGEFSACFNDADIVMVAPVYAAGEEPITGASHRDLVAGLISHGHRHARIVESEDDLARLVVEQSKPGDIVVCLGAGTISTWANALPEKLAR